MRRTEYATLTEAASFVFPLDSRLNADDVLEIGGCDVLELAHEYGTPAYIYAEHDLRMRARELLEAFGRRTDRLEVLFASKAFPCAAACRIMAEEGLSCDAASGGELRTAYRYGDDVPTADEWVEALLSGAPEGATILCEPGRALVANAGVTIYSVGTVKEIPGVRTYVGVDGGMSDNMRPMLYDAPQEAEIAGRFGGDRLCTVAGMHCESGDVLVRDVLLDEPRRGDVLVIPATGAYSYALANNYNQIPRPPVVFCRDGEARVVVRRETYEDLALRDC